MKKILTYIVVIIVILGMAAGYIFSAFNFTAPQAETGFTGPTGEPFVNGPTSPPPGSSAPTTNPSVEGPTSLPQ